MFQFASIKIINSENPFSNPVQTPCSGDCDPENAYRKPAMMGTLVKSTNGREAMAEFTNVREEKLVCLQN